MRNWLIRLLGGIPKPEHERVMDDFKGDCERWVSEFLRDHREREWVLGADSRRSGQDYPDMSLSIIGSRVSVSSARVAGFYVAPWVRSCSLDNIVVTQPQQEHPNG